MIIIPFFAWPLIKIGFRFVNRLFPLGWIKDKAITMLSEVEREYIRLGCAVDVRLDGRGEQFELQLSLCCMRYN